MNYEGTDHFFEVVRQTPLLTRDQEDVLARQVAAGRQAAATLAENADGIPADQAAELERMIQAGGEAKEHFVKANILLVASIAGKLMLRVRNSLEYADLIQSGTFGLFDAADKFDPKKGRFSTYATRWVTKRMLLGIYEGADDIRKPRDVNEKLTKLRSEERELQKWNIDPTSQQLADLLDTDTEYIEELKEWRMPVAHLDAPITADEPAVLSDLLEDSHAGSDFDSVDHAITGAELQSFISMLDVKQADIIRSYYGFDRDVPETLTDIGKRYGVTYGPIKDQEQKAVTELRASLGSNKEAYLG